MSTFNSQDNLVKRMHELSGTRTTSKAVLTQR